MNCSRNTGEAQARVHLVRNAGVDARAITPPGDPIAAWLDLMEVVEALRPKQTDLREVARTLPEGRAFRL